MENKGKIILHLCADIGSDSKPYADSGYDVRLIGKDIGVENYTPPEGVYGIIANPVCGGFSIARTGKARDIKGGCFLLEHCLRVIRLCRNLKFWTIENPATGGMKEVMGKPDFIYEPWEFGSPWTKKTALWGKFNKPKKVYEKWIDVPKISLYTRPGRSKPALAFMHKSAINLIPEFKCFASKVDSDMAFRSLCSQNFASAFFEANQ